ncbi:HEWD family protein [Halobacterium litoreum]|uniref:HEWD family protein n=1 Tax=Halobacterium litoreum TaxID=2039234 RepID=A0ABD5NC30_9EURY|nr:HEWD family protein [Halobacterium litoreum]UHH14252.1 hypothetical protein LT972_04435 [Halobacterium litoreum]
MAQIRAPSERTCTDCGRSERWDRADRHWKVDGEEGDVFCVHAWDVTGSFTTVEK